MSIKVSMISLGCAKNQVDSEVMLAKLNSAGFEIVEEDIHADVAVVNTCGFIESAVSEAIETILDVAWLRQNRTLKGIVVTGCMAQRFKNKIFEEMPEVDAAVGVGNLDNIVEAVTFAYEHGGEDVPKYCRFDRPETQALGGDRVVSEPTYAAYLKISEGCNNACAYCTIPSIRGRFRSRSMEDLVAEAKDLASLGTKELIVVSQDTTKYGIDLYGELKLPELLERLCRVDGIEWVRLLYCYADEVTEALADTIAREPKIVHYLDMPIQHLSDKVLAAMNRRDTGKLIADKVAMLRQKVPDITLRTTVMVGFPGETDEDVDLLAQGLEALKFDRVGAFMFSPEEGTLAAKMEEQVDDEDKQERYDRIMSLQQGIHEAHNEALVGKTLRVLCEGYDPAASIHYGRSFRDAPEVDGKVYFTSPKKIAPGCFVDVCIEQTMEYDVIGSAVLA